ncbi:MAG: hypothetical protein AAF518_06195 [Spirochaetota bacterium]
MQTKYHKRFSNSFTLLAITFFLLIGCAKVNKEKVKFSIKKIQDSINQQNIEEYGKYAQDKSLYDLGRLLIGIAKTKKGNVGEVVKIIPEKITSKGELTYVKVILDFDANIDISENTVPVQIPKELINGILSIGLPPNADFTMRQSGENYKLEEVSYPWKYSFLKIFF